MEFEGGGDEEDARRFAADDVSGEVAETFEITGFEMFADTQPIVEGLKRELEIGGGFELDDDEAASVVDAKQIDDAAIAGSEDGDLSIDGLGAERSVNVRGTAADERFEPGFRTGIDGGAFAVRRAAGREGGIDVADIGEIDDAGAIALVVANELTVHFGCVETGDAEGDVVSGSDRDVEKEMSDREGLFAAAQMVEPDETEGEDAGASECAGRGGDGGDAGRAEAEQGTRVRRREAGFEIGVGADLDDLPFGPFAGEDEVEAFTKGDAGGAAFEIASGGRSEVGDFELGFGFEKALGDEAEAVAAAFLESDNLADEIALLIPGLQDEAAIPFLQTPLIGDEGERVFAGIEHGGLHGGGDEGFDGLA